MTIDASDPDNKPSDKGVGKGVDPQVVEFAGGVESIVSLPKNEKPLLEAQHISETLYGLKKGDKYISDPVSVGDKDLGMLAYHGFLPPRFKFRETSKGIFRSNVIQYLKMSSVFLTQGDLVSNQELVNNFICYFGSDFPMYRDKVHYQDFLNGQGGVKGNREENTTLAQQLQVGVDKWCLISEGRNRVAHPIPRELLEFLYQAYTRMYWHSSVRSNHDLFS